LQHAFDLCGVDADRGAAVIHAEQLLGDQATKGVSDDYRPGREPVDDLRVVVGDLVDSVVGDAVGVGSGGLDGVGVAGPAGGGRLIARLGE